MEFRIVNVHNHVIFCMRIHARGGGGGGGGGARFILMVLSGGLYNRVN